MNVKIQFSPEELRCMHDTGFLLRKRVITDKLYKILHELTDVLISSPAHAVFKFPAGVDFKTGKISRGENYKGLPFVILDFPRWFDKENVFAFRTMFWWGNYFSFTLHLKGMPLEQYSSSILANYHLLEENNILLYTGDDEWMHDLNDHRYVPISLAVDSIRKMSFLKLSRKVEIEEIDFLAARAKKTYEVFLDVLGR